MNLLAVWLGQKVETTPFFFCVGSWTIAGVNMPKDIISIKATEISLAAGVGVHGASTYPPHGGGGGFGGAEVWSS